MTSRLLGHYWSSPATHSLSVYPNAPYPTGEHLFSIAANKKVGPKAHLYFGNLNNLIS